MDESDHRWRGSPVPRPLHDRLVDGVLTESDWDWIESNRELLTIQQFGAINGAIQRYIESHDEVEVRPFAEYNGRDGYHEALPLDISDIYTPTHVDTDGASDVQQHPYEVGDVFGLWRVEAIDDDVVTLSYLGESDGHITMTVGARNSSEHLRIAAKNLAERSELLSEE